MEIQPELASRTETGEPVPGFPVRFSWHSEYWTLLFDSQVELIRRDVRRARADGKLIVYLSCPISARGGGDQSTNVEIARAVERRLLNQWGEKFWLLNPAQYQLESKQGTGLMEWHAREHGIDLAALRKCSQPSGGDYMRMWTKVLVDDQAFDEFTTVPDRLKRTGQHFDAYYFLGPKDVSDFFCAGNSVSLTDGIESYFARRFATDPDFRDNFSVDGINWRKGWVRDPSLGEDDRKLQLELRHQWTAVRRQFLKFYALKASVNFSLGSHDEWEIYRQINALRRTDSQQGDNLGIAEQVGGFFDQSQIDPSACETVLSRGYRI